MIHVEAKRFLIDKFLVCLVFSLSLLFMHVRSLADSFRLNDGGVVTGKFLNDPKSEVIKFQTNDGIVLELPRTQCKDIRTATERETEYLKLIAGKPDTADVHREIAKECLSLHQSQLADAHKERVVELDPADNYTWAALGYLQQKGLWVKKEVLATSKGLVRTFGKGQNWVTPHARAIAEADDRIKQSEAKFREEIDRHYKNLNQSGEKRFDAENYFRSLNNFLAVKHILKRAKDDLANNRPIELWMNLLEQMPGTSATYAIIEIAMLTNNRSIQDECMRLLMRSKESTEIALNAFLTHLDNRNSDVNKKIATIDLAAQYLGTLNDERAIVPLINKLNSLVKQTVTRPNTVSPNGGGMSFGNNSQTLERMNNHAPVRDALISITGENFGFDQREWGRWYARTHAEENLDLRRNP